jgi:hypothetical protein
VVTLGMAPAGERGGHVQMLLGAYLLGGLSAGEASAVRAHLDRCTPCRAEHDDLACVPSWLSLLPALETPAGVGFPTGDGDEDSALRRALSLVDDDPDDQDGPIRDDRDGPIRLADGPEDPPADPSQ